MTPQQIEALKLALEALKAMHEEGIRVGWHVHPKWSTGMDNAVKAITAIKEALVKTTQPSCDLAPDGVCETLDCPNHEPQFKEPKIGCVNHDCDQCKAQPEQEPVAMWDGKYQIEFGNLSAYKHGEHSWIPLYTTPPQRTEPVIDKSAAIRIATALGWTPPRPWVGLTDEEISEVLGSDIHDEPSGELRFIRAIEAKLKEKNT